MPSPGWEGEGADSPTETDTAGENPSTCKAGGGLLYEFRKNCCLESAIPSQGRLLPSLLLPSHPTGGDPSLLHQLHVKPQKCFN